MWDPDPVNDGYVALHCFASEGAFPHQVGRILGLRLCLVNTIKLILYNFLILLFRCDAMENQ